MRVRATIQFVFTLFFPEAHPMRFVHLRFAFLAAVLFALVTQAAPDVPAPVASASPITHTRADTPKTDEADQVLIDLVTNPTGGFNDKAFTKGQYKLVRAAFAKYFEARH